jgi:hypothetical protein
MEKRLDIKPKEGYPVVPSDIIHYNWGSIIAYLQIDFNFSINQVLEFAEKNVCEGREVAFAEHVIALIYNAVRNERLKNVHHIRKNPRLDMISGRLQHYYENIIKASGKKPPEISDIDLDIIADEFIYSITEKDFD